MSDRVEHTPGPWRWQLFGGKDWCLVGAHGLIPIILDCGQDDDDNWILRSRIEEPDMMVDFDPEHPNSRLLRAAPDLMEACEAIVDHVLQSVGEANAVTDQVIAAIAKAKGE